MTSFGLKMCWCCTMTIVCLNIWISQLVCKSHYCYWLCYFCSIGLWWMLGGQQLLIVERKTYCEGDLRWKLKVESSITLTRCFVKSVLVNNLNWQLLHLKQLIICYTFQQYHSSSFIPDNKIIKQKTYSAWRLGRIPTSEKKIPMVDKISHILLC